MHTLTSGAKPRSVAYERARLALSLAYRFPRDVWHWMYSKPEVFLGSLPIANCLSTIDLSTTDTAGQDTAQPIFILASGWRTGSTLLQRILVTDPKLLMWGEPLGELGVVSQITNMLAQEPTFSRLAKRTLDRHPPEAPLATSWIANLCPPGKDLRLALRTLFDRWLGVPALEKGFERWGFKEVRLGAAEAMVLHWLYPRAKFLLLTRRPFECYLSLSDARWNQLYYRRPDVQVDSPARFARFWNNVVLSWSILPADFPCFRIKYEDLVSGHFDFRWIESWLGVRIAEDIALSDVVGSTSKRPRLAWHERFIISRAASKGMRAVGYSE